MDVCWVKEGVFQGGREQVRGRGGTGGEYASVEDGGTFEDVPDNRD